VIIINKALQEQRKEVKNMKHAKKTVKVVKPAVKVVKSATNVKNVLCCTCGTTSWSLPAVKPVSVLTRWLVSLFDGLFGRYAPSDKMGKKW